MKKQRTHIPNEVSRQIKVEAGHQCGIWRCQITSHLERHHIDENPSNNDPDNLILLCRQHHAMATAGEITKLEQKEYKRKLKEMLIPRIKLYPDEKPILKQVDLNYPFDSGLQTKYEREEYELRWSSEDKLARRIDLDGWEYAFQDLPDGKRAILKGPNGELTLIAKKKQ